MVFIDALMTYQGTADGSRLGYPPAAILFRGTRVRDGCGEYFMTRRILTIDVAITWDVRD